MNPATRYARRYHWLGKEVKSFVEEPHNAIASENLESFVLNLVAKESRNTQNIITELTRQPPDKTIQDWEKTVLHLPSHHPITGEDIQTKNLKSILISTYQNPPSDFQGLLLYPGVGAKTLRALSLISEIIYGQPPSFKDPARFSFAHGGKDGYPYPVDRRLYDGSVEILEKAIKNAQLGKREELETFKRLSLFTA